MKFLITTLSILLTTLTFGQTAWYVSQTNGNDTENDGKSPNKAFATISRVTEVVKAGDEIVLVGTFTNTSYDEAFEFTNVHDAQLWHQENTIRINGLHGKKDAYITIRPHNSQTILRGDGANIFRVMNSSCLRIKNFIIEGEVKNIPLSVAEALNFVYTDKDEVVNEHNPTPKEIQYRYNDCIRNCFDNPETSENEITKDEVYSNIKSKNVARPSYTDTRGMYLSNVDSIEIINNTIRYMPGGGLRVAECEDILIKKNTIHDCARRSFSGTHGLVVTKAQSTRTTNDYRIKIIRNTVHHNYNELVSWSPNKTNITPDIDEGKGISLQRNETTRDQETEEIKINWEHGKILVANNLCYFNGFSGVHSNDGNRIDMFHNTCYFNSFTRSNDEEFTSNNGGNIGISAQGGSKINIINNIVIIDSELNKSAISSDLTVDDGLVVKDNIIYGTAGEISEDASVTALQENTIQKDPLFVDPAQLNFTLQPNSPALNKGKSLSGLNHDYRGELRDDKPDLGAFERQAVLSVGAIILAARQINQTVQLQLQTTELPLATTFRLEKSADGTTWQSLVKEFTQYSYIDAQPFTGRNYYRLLTIDSQGLVIDQQIITIDVNVPKSLRIFPNPTTALLNIGHSDSVVSAWRIFSMQGKDCSAQVRVNSNGDQLQLNVAQLVAGGYYLRLENGTTHRFVVSK